MAFFGYLHSHHDTARRGYLLTTMDTYFLSFEGGLWQLSSPGAKRAIRNFNTREDAMEYSTAYVRAHGGFLKIRTEDGKFQEKRTYPEKKKP